MTSFKAGDIVLVQYPFTDFTSSKKRPAIILNSLSYAALHHDVIVMPLTSQPQKDVKLELKKWQDAGLPKPTWLKPAIATIAESLIVKKIGQLGDADQQCVRQALRTMLARSWVT
jgi:mRNA interferase MazF